MGLQSMKECNTNGIANERKNIARDCKRTNKTITQMGLQRYCGILPLCYGLLNISIGLDEDSFTGRGSSPVNIPFALRVPRPRGLSARQRFLEVIAIT